MKHYKTQVTDMLIIAFGSFLLAFAVSFFYLPNQIIAGGAAGLAVALYPIFGIEPTLMINLVIGITFIMGYLFLGKKFALRSLASSMMFPIFIAFFKRFNFNVPIDPLMASAFGGAICGVGLGLTFRTGSSTGGMDIPPLILAKHTNIKLSFWIILVDSITVLLGVSSYGVNNVLIGLVSILTTSYAIDKIQMLGGQQAKQVFIISSHNDEILEQIHSKISRGSTLIQSRGGYTKLSREIIMTVLLKHQYSELERVVKDIDPTAFLIVSDVTEVHGEGFYTV